MGQRPYSLGAMANLATLAIGLVMGFYFGTMRQEKVQAQTTKSATENVTTTATASAQKIEEVTPIMTVGSAGIGLLLAHEINADSVIVQGFDILKLHQSIYSYLAKQPFANQAELQRLVNDAKAPIIHRVKARSEEKPNPDKKEDKK